jgi:hypothetical protein
VNASGKVSSLASRRARVRSIRQRSGSFDFTGEDACASVLARGTWCRAWRVQAPARRAPSVAHGTS